MASVLPSTIGDARYEKRKAAALEVEQVVKRISGDHARVRALVDRLISEFAFSPAANHRKGALLCLAAAAVGLADAPGGEQHLRQIVPPILASFTDQDARVRYYGERVERGGDGDRLSRDRAAVAPWSSKRERGVVCSRSRSHKIATARQKQHQNKQMPACEALYNVAKSAREGFVEFFPEVFDATFRLCADAEPNVQSAIQFLDSLVKVRNGLRAGREVDGAGERRER